MTDMTKGLVTMKLLLTAIGLFAITGCSLYPRTDIHVVDNTGAPISGFPLGVELSDGLRGVSLPHSVDQDVTSKMELRTNKKGRASIQYDFLQKQPSESKSNVFGADRIANQWIKITPLQDLPKGSSITVGIPNP